MAYNTLVDLQNRRCNQSTHPSSQLEVLPGSSSEDVLGTHDLEIEVSYSAFDSDQSNTISPQHPSAPAALLNPSEPEPVTETPLDLHPSPRPSSSSINSLQFGITKAGFQEMLDKSHTSLLESFHAHYEVRFNKLDSEIKELRRELKENGKSSNNSISRLGEKLGEFFVSAYIYSSGFLLEVDPQTSNSLHPSRNPSRNPSPSRIGPKEYPE
jgi:hypothetical protein